MKSTPLVFCLELILGALAFASSAQAQSGDHADERAIRAVIERVNLALAADTAQKGVELMTGVISDKGFAFVQRNPEQREALVGGRKLFLDVLAKSLRAGPKWGTHKIHEVAIVGPIAYTIGATENSEQDTHATRWLNVFAKEDVGWRWVYSTPADDIQQAFRQLGEAKARPTR